MMTKTEVLTAKATNTPVWFIENWSERIYRAIVQDTKTENNKEYAKLRGLGGGIDNVFDFTGTEGHSFERLFPSREALEAHIKSKENEKINKIKKQIQTKDDLIQFMFDNVVACAEEYTDWTARETVRQIALERWNIKLD